VGEPVDPGPDRLGGLDPGRVPVDPQHHVLKDVLGGLARADAPPDEGEQAFVERSQRKDARFAVAPAVRE